VTLTVELRGAIWTARRTIGERRGAACELRRRGAALPAGGRAGGIEP
jgi:hypothetical protein